MVRILLILLLFLYGSIFSQENKQSTTKEALDNNKKIIEQNRETKTNIIEDVNKDRYDTDKAKTYSTKKDHDLREGNVFLLGVSMGSPGGANLNVMYYWKNIVLRGSGGYWGKRMNGYQFDLGYSFYRGASIIQSLSLVGGGFTSTPFNPTPGFGGQNKYKIKGYPPGYANYPSNTTSDLLIRSYIAQQNPDLALALEYVYNPRSYQEIRQNYIGLTYDIYMWGFFMQIGAGFGDNSPKHYRDPQLLYQIGYMLEL